MTTRTAAKSFGAIAFANGRPAQPGCDADLMAMVKEAGSFTKQGRALMAAWLRGWHTANAAAEI